MSPTSPRLTGARHQAISTAPFKLHRGSHLIHKQSSSSSSSSSSTNSSVSSSSGLANNAAAHRPPPRQQQKHPQQQPVIIYTHSPKVIRTNPRDFMSIVQKLTGLESSAAARADASSSPPTAYNAGSAVTSQDESSSSTESCANACQTHAAPPPQPYIDPQQIPPPAPPPPQLGTHFMPEIPLFTQGTSDLLCASRGLYGGVPFAPVMSSTSTGGSGGTTIFSPSTVDEWRR
ncbi:hypothetical protein GUJ93_ZPchr0010g8870 [Zizania palustris]|uniref:VQ domain-containing protein n=1 Tax=Zizania palustris TaxID=103762 RepID=A0A8J6BBU8_ZIZPA|nr:hypothetical protein GUJ93_ZPchr0010g8870 [Zizania palustris]